MTTITTINIRTLKVSVHARAHRWDRITRCVQADGGLGEVVFVCDSTKGKYSGERVVQVLTSTGMMLVVNVTTNTLVTAYLASMRYTMGLYYSAGINRLPDEMFRVIKYNERKLSHLYNL